MQLLPLTVLSFTWFGIVPRQVVDEPLTVLAHEARATISTRPSPIPASYGPAVTFAVLAQFDCAGDATAESVVVSIADTVARHTPAADDDSALLSIVVPGDQIVPVDTGEFCTGTASQSGDALLLAAAATAQVSLRCRDDNGPVMHFQSVALPLRLTCDTGKPQDESSVSSGR